MDNDTTTVARLRRERLEPLIVERFLNRGQSLKDAQAYIAECGWDPIADLRRISHSRK